MTTMTATAQPDTLFQITDDLIALDNLLIDSGGELTPEIEAWMAASADRLEGKVDGTAWHIRNLEAKAEIIRAHAARVRREADELEAKAVTVDKRVLRTKDYVRFCLERRGETKAEGKVYSIAIEANGGPAPLEIHEPFKSDPSQLPEMLKLVKVSPDTKAIRSALSQGVFLDVATLLPRGSHVRVR
jgi:hypothetical protein